jgi:aromatic ring-opening dioxygenase LigB subunit
MLVFAAFTPHTPLLLPSIGKDHLEALVATRGAVDHLAEELYAAHPDTILVISGHDAPFPSAFSGNLHDPYRTDFSAFGDVTTTSVFSADVGMLDAIQRSVRRHGLPFTLFSHPILDEGTSVPLTVLTEPLKHVAIVPLSHSDLSPKQHFEFGRILKDVIHASPRRIAVLATGDLSHALSSKSPAGLKKEGGMFDQSIRDAVQSCSAMKLLSLDQAVVHNAVQCGYLPLVILMGILDGTQTRPDELAYEAPFGVGYLVARFV